MLHIYFKETCNLYFKIEVEYTVLSNVFNLRFIMRALEAEKFCKTNVYGTLNKKTSELILKNGAQHRARPKMNEAKTRGFREYSEKGPTYLLELTSKMMSELIYGFSCMAFKIMFLFFVAFGLNIYPFIAYKK